MQIRKSLFQYSLIILLIFALIVTYYEPVNGSIIKVIIYLNIYLTFLFIPNLKVLKFHIPKGALFIFHLLLAYGFFCICRDLNEGELVSLLGNPYFGPSFIIPIYLIWVTKINALYWLNRISLISGKLGILLIPISFIFKLNMPGFAFLPTFFLLLNYNYVERKDRMWIILNTVLGIILFWFNDYRTGVIRILFCIAIFIFVQLNLRWAYKYVVLILFSIPVFALSLGIFTGKSIFEEISSSKISSDKNMVLDTRTFLYVETFSDLIKTNSLIFGKGPLGTYYSDYFYAWSGEGGDNKIRHNVEVGVLHYLLKGGIVYLLLVFIIVIYAIVNGLYKSNNKYIKSLALILVCFLFISFIENTPAYGAYFASVWIIVGICLSKKYKKLNDFQIKYLIQTQIPENDNLHRHPILQPTNILKRPLGRK